MRQIVAGKNHFDTTKGVVKRLVKMSTPFEVVRYKAPFAIWYDINDVNRPVLARAIP